MTRMYCSSFFGHLAVRTAVYLFASHGIYYVSELVHQKFCASNYWLSLFTSGSTACAGLRRVSDLSGSHTYAALTSIAYALGGATGGLMRRDPAISCDPPPRETPEEPLPDGSSP